LTLLKVSEYVDQLASNKALEPTVKQPFFGIFRYLVIYLFLLSFFPVGGGSAYRYGFTYLL